MNKIVMKTFRGDELDGEMVSALWNLMAFGGLLRRWDWDGDPDVELNCIPALKRLEAMGLVQPIHVFDLDDIRMNSEAWALTAEGAPVAAAIWHGPIISQEPAVIPLLEQISGGKAATDPALGGLEEAGVRH